LTDPYTKKRREKCVLFLDDCFDSVDSPARLLAAGFCGVESFVTHFQDRLEAGKEQGVKDPRIIRLCNRRKWLLVTTDSDIRNTHVEEIKRCPDLAILATAHNTVEDIDGWVEALILALKRGSSASTRSGLGHGMRISTVPGKLSRYIP